MIRLAPVLVITAIVAGCGPKTAAPTPPPFPLTQQATGHYCGMNLLEHKGPKGQIILASQVEPIWFSSARDAFSFTMLAEEPKDIRAVYVSDMAKAPSWDKPGANNWVDAHRASFVIGSSKRGGWVLPRPSRSLNAAAAAFAAANGGKVVTFAKVPRDYVLSSDPGFNTKDLERAARARRRPMTSLFCRRKFVTISAAATGFALLPFGASRGAAAASRLEWQGMSLGGIATIRLHHPDRATGERLLERVVAEARRLEAIFSLYRRSPISVNSTGAASSLRHPQAGGPTSSLRPRLAVNGRGLRSDGAIALAVLCRALFRCKECPPTLPLRRYWSSLCVWLVGRRFASTKTGSCSSGAAWH